VEYDKYLDYQGTVKGEDLELSTIRSRQSSKLSSLLDMRPNGAINPAYTETEFIRYILLTTSSSIFIHVPFIIFLLCIIS